MTQKFDVGLNARLNDFVKKNGIVRTEANDAEVFEDFANYVIASNLLEEELDNVKSISTNKAQGLDGIVIIVNNRLVSEESDLEKFGPTEPIRIKIGFIQSTIQNSFCGQKFSAFTDKTVEFLTKKIDIEPYSTIYKKLLDDSGNFIDRIEETPYVSLFFLSARTAHSVTEDQISAERNKITGRSELENKCILKNFVFLQKDEIKNEYDKISKYHAVQLKFDNNVQLPSVENVEMSLLTTVKFSELKKLILTSDNNLKEKLFVENVRNYIGSTPVNLDIRKTLDANTERHYFPFLNNGLAIICNKIERHPVKRDEFTLFFPRIINGCQTTNILYNKYKENIDDLDDVEIIAKVIATDDNNLKKKIIYAANNQNSITKDLQSLNDFHEKIEEYFSGKETVFNLFFERLRGQYSSVEPPYSKINIETIARVYISVFLQKPHEIKTNVNAKMAQYTEEKKIFVTSHNIADYYYCGVLWYWLQHFLLNRVIELKSKTMDMHVLMACNLNLDNRPDISSIENKIDYICQEDKVKYLFEQMVKLLNSKNYLFEKRGFYSNPKTEQLIKEINDATN